MGFFSKLKNLATPGKNPGGKLRMAFDPAGETIRTVTGADGLNGFIDPSGRILRDKPDVASNPATASSTMVDTYGDATDPAFGSFADPFTVEDFYDYADPGYAFQLQQGQQAVLNNAATGGSALSGAAIKDLLKFNQDYAGTAYNDAFNRYQTQQGNIFSRLSSLLQLGQNAASNVGAQGTQLAGQAGQAIANAGAASGAGYVGAGNNIGSGLTNYWLMRQFGGMQPQAVTGGV
jgi:hypothetical protein